MITNEREKKMSSNVNYGIYLKKSLYTKEQVLKKIKCLIDKELDELSESDIYHAVPFYKIIKNCLEDLYKSVDGKDLPELNNNMCYAIVICEDGVELRIENIGFDKEDDKVIRLYCDLYTLYRNKCKALTLEEFANEKDVSIPVVLQMVRRGLIPTAYKISNYWLIPETALYGMYKSNERTYKWDLNEARFLIDKDVYKNIEYLNEYNTVTIKNKDKKELKKGERGKFILTFSRLNDAKVKLSKDKEDELDTKEKERFESMLIANQFVKYDSNEICYISEI